MALYEHADTDSLHVHARSLARLTWKPGPKNAR
nr:hypothetical protein [Lactiplantibacillus plantarum]